MEKVKIILVCDNISKTDISSENINYLHDTLELFGVEVIGISINNNVLTELNYNGPELCKDKSNTSIDEIIPKLLKGRDSNTILVILSEEDLGLLTNKNNNSYSIVIDEFITTRVANRVLSYLPCNLSVSSVLSTSKVKINPKTINVSLYFKDDRALDLDSVDASPKVEDTDPSERYMKPFKDTIKNRVQISSENTKAHMESKIKCDIDCTTVEYKSSRVVDSNDRTEKPTITTAWLTVKNVGTRLSEFRKRLIKEKGEKMKIIAIEGCDGVGKSTAVENIKLELERTGLKVRIVKSLPANTKLGKLTRELIGDGISDTQAVQLFLANIPEVIEEIISAEAEGVDIVLMDRWILSTIVYGKIDITQDTRIDEHSQSLLAMIDKTLAMASIDVSATLYFEAPLSVVESRIKGRAIYNDMYTNKVSGILNAYNIRVSEAIAQLLPSVIMKNIGRIITIDATANQKVLVDDCVDSINALFRYDK